MSAGPKPVPKSQAQLHNAARNSLDFKIGLGNSISIVTGLTSGIMLFSGDKKQIRTDFQTSSTQIAATVETAPGVTQAEPTNIPYTSCALGILSLALCAWTNHQRKLRQVYFSSSKPM